MRITTYHSFLTLMLALAVGVGTTLFLLVPREKYQEITPVITTQKSSSPSSEPETIAKTPFTMALVGDVLPLHVRDPFRDNDLRAVLKNADIAVANLECPLSVRGEPAPIKFHRGRRKYREWIFGARPEVAQSLQNAGIDVVSLANNHMMDHSVPALLDTFKALSQKNIEYVGAGNNIDEARLPVVLERGGTKIAFLSYVSSYTLPGTKGFIATEDVPGLAFVFPGKDGRPQKSTLSLLKADIAKAKEQADLVAIALHWGKEFKLEPNVFQRELAHCAINEGADVIIGHHAHVLNGIEIYKGKPIFYSLGDFIFQTLSPICSRTGIVHMNLDSSGVREILFYPAFIPVGATIPRRNDPEGQRTLQMVRNLSSKLGTKSVIARQNGQPVLRVIVNKEQKQKQVKTVQFPAGNSHDFLELGRVIPNLRIGMPYATKQNVFHEKMYEQERAFLRRDVARRLLKAQEILDGQGLRLKIWDAYRPLSVQRKMWRQVHDVRYVANPKTGGSRHNRGAAVDVTLVDKTGKELEMPTGFDDFSAKAHANYAGASQTARKNRAILRDAMVTAGFKPLATEWWHFDAPDASRYPVSDVSFEKLAPR